MVSTYILIAAIAYVVGLLILYLVIKSAVSSAIWDMKESAKMHSRYLLLKMKKEGFSQTEIDNVYTMNDKQFVEWYNTIEGRS